MTESSVRSERRGAVQIVWLNRPAKRNALNTKLLQELDGAMWAADNDTDVRALILTGAGPAFCSGADLSESPDGDPTAASRRAEQLASILGLARRLTKPVVSVVCGAALGAGASLAISGDLMVVGDDLVLGYPEVQRSRVPSAVIATVQRQLDLKRAFELITLGRMLNASEALEFGLATRVATPEAALSAGLAIATMWAELDQDVLVTTKRLFYDMAERTS